MRAVFIDCTSELQAVIERRQLVIPDNVSVNLGSPPAQELVELCAGADAIFVEHTVVPPAVFDACPSVRAVVFMGTGAGTYIDMTDARRRGIRVATTPGYGDRAVAEHAFALMFSAARSIARMDREIRTGAWSPRGGLQLSGRKVAVIGLGGIGTEFAHLARSIGMNVYAWNRTPRTIEGFVEDIDEALANADVVSIHLALNAETTGLIDRRRLELPAPGYILVNTARAEIVDQEAMLAFLGEGHIGHAGLDVFSQEPLPGENAYRRLDNLTLTAHAAYMTDDAYEELWRRTLAAFDELRLSAMVSPVP